MKRVTATLKRVIASAAFVLAFGGVAQANVTNQLGFLLDSSGSVDTADYNLLRSGLNAAIATLPIDGSIEITVVRFSTSTSTVVAPTVLDAMTLAGIQSAISNHSRITGGTNTAAGINAITGLITGSANFSAANNSAINLATDGVSNSQTATVAAAGAAATAGIDSLSIEAIGDGLTSQGAINNLLATAFPGPATLLAQDATNIPNPTGGSWVVPVSNFNAFENVVTAKVQAVIQPPNPNPVPEPGMLALLGAGIFAMVFAGRRRAGVI